MFYVITRQSGGSCKKCPLQPEVQTCRLRTSVWTCCWGKNGLCTDPVKGMIPVLFVLWMLLKSCDHISCPCPKESESEWGSQISVTTFSQRGSNVEVYQAMLRFGCVNVNVWISSGQGCKIWLGSTSSKDRKNCILLPWGNSPKLIAQSWGQWRICGIKWEGKADPEKKAKQKDMKWGFPKAK